MGTDDIIARIAAHAEDGAFDLELEPLAAGEVVDVKACPNRRMPGADATGAVVLTYGDGRRYRIQVERW